MTNEVSAFEQSLDDYIKRSLCVVPIMPGTKAPGAYVYGQWQAMREWTQYSHAPASMEMLAHWVTWPNAGIGLCTGSGSGVIALDFDNFPELHEEVLRHLPESPLRKVGARGFTSFYRFNGETNTKWSRDGSVFIELLSTGRQTVMPPSAHPSGVSYRWLTEKTFAHVATDDLPVIPESFFEYLNRLCGNDANPRRMATQGRTAQTAMTDEREKELREALAYIPAEDYHTWVKIGMALHAEDSERGLALFHEWSSKSDKYSSSATEQKWRSFRGNHSVNPESIFFIAREHGYDVPPPTVVPLDFSHLASVPEVLPCDIADYEPHRLGIPESLAKRAPGLVGRIADWIDETSHYYHPALSLGAALALVGTLKGHRVQSESGLRTNIYVAGLAPTGAGKNHALVQVARILEAAGLHDKLGLGAPQSENGLRASLEKVQGRGLIAWDEVGLALAEMTSKYAGPMKKTTMKAVMSLFSKSQSSIDLGNEYASADLQRPDLKYPCLSIYGASTEKRWWEAFQGSHAIDGCLSRWLLCQTQNTRALPRKIDVADEVPPEIIRDVLEIEKWSTNAQPTGNLTVEGPFRILNPRKVMYTEDARELSHAKRLEYTHRVHDANDMQRDDEAAIYTRVWEIATKVALISEDGDKITCETLNWAFELVERSAQTMIESLSDEVSDNDTQKTVQTIFKIIRKGGKAGVSKSVLTRKTQNLTMFERNEAIKTLAESGQIALSEESTGGRPSVKFFALKNQSTPSVIE